MIQRRHIIIIVFLLTLPLNLHAIFPLNIFRPYDLNTYKNYRGKNSLVDINVTGEFGIKTVGRSSCDLPCDPSLDGCDVNVLHVWQNQQNGLAMLKGFDPSSEIGSLAQELNVDDDDGVRGHFCATGDLNVKANILLSTRWYLRHHFIFGVYLPVTSLQLKNVCFKDLTPEVTAEDILTKELLTNNFAQNVQRLGCLNICGWDVTSIGDLAAIVEWVKNFPQAKPVLKDVRTSVRAGFNFPTGRQADPSQMMSVPLGNEAFGFIFGGALDLKLSSFFKTGLDVQFLKLFSNIRTRRIKTDEAQTDLLFLAEADALKDFGFTQRFNLYACFYRFFRNLSAQFTYQFFKHDDDKLSLVRNCYSDAIANTAKSLEEWTIHNFIYQLNYDFEDLTANSRCHPYVAVFYKQPINGKNSFLAHTAGFELTLTF